LVSGLLGPEEEATPAPAPRRRALERGLPSISRQLRGLPSPEE
jgi:hypothetical protein